MNNITTHESHSDIEELFNKEEGERPCYLSDEVHSENVTGAHAASNSDMEANSTVKFANLDTSSSIQEDGQVHEGDSTHECGKTNPGNQDVTEEGKEQFSCHFETDVCNDLQHFTERKNRSWLRSSVSRGA